MQKGVKESSSKEPQNKKAAVSPGEAANRLLRPGSRTKTLRQNAAAAPAINDSQKASKTLWASGDCTNTTAAALKKTLRKETAGQTTAGFSFLIRRDEAKRNKKVSMTAPTYLSVRIGGQKTNAPAAAPSPAGSRYASGVPAVNAAAKGEKSPSNVTPLKKKPVRPAASSPAAFLANAGKTARLFCAARTPVCSMFFTSFFQRYPYLSTFE